MRVTYSRRPHATLALLHHDRENETLVNRAGRSDALDRSLQVSALLVGVVGLAKLRARDGDVGHVGSPHAVEIDPGAHVWPAGSGGSDTSVSLVGVRAGAAGAAC